MNLPQYGINDIKTLEGIEAIRLRPGMYIGSTGPDGVRHITLEIVSNAIDEYLNGHCTVCDIFVNTDNTIIISDNGRGIPFGKQEDGSETLENIFTKLHTGAKFDSSGKTGYNTSGGMNGVGAKATNALSEYFEVASCRDKQRAVMKFEKGIKVSYDVKAVSASSQTGTTITFKPDAEIFKEGIEIEYAPLKKQIQELAYLSPGMKFELKYKDSPMEVISSTNGLIDYLDYLNSKNPITDKFYAETFEDRVGVKIALMYNDGFSDTYKLYTNSIPNSAGTHLTGFRTALTQSINVYAKTKGLLKEKDANFTSEDLKEGLVLVLSLIMPDPVFSGQTKDTLTSSEARTIVQRLVSQEIKIWLDSHEKDAKAIINKALLARKARENARKARENVRNTTVKNTRTMLPGKLADCSSSNRKNCEIFIVEGDSAAGSTKEARDRDTQAVFPIRGKIINCLKADLNKIMKNDIISSIVSAFGLSTDGKQIFVDESKLRYGKIIITADADVDGSHIRILFLTFIWKFVPELIEKGYIYAAVPPLFKATQGTKIFYLKDEAALEEFKNSTKRAFELTRMKGLGEMDPAEMSNTVMNPETRTLKQITMEDAGKVANMFNALMGDSAVLRKVFIEQNASKANLDV